MNKAFTLVELIVTITILAVLWTIAFMSFQNYTVYARDVVRVSDLNNMKSVLEYSYTETWMYPEPDTWTGMTFSWAVVWTQWTFWKDVRRATKRLNEIPTDPLTNNEYTYSVLNTNSEFELWAVFEWDEISVNSESENNQENNILWTEIYAAWESFKAYIIWNYNWQLAKTSTGWVDYILALPSIINSDITITRIEDIVSQKKLSLRNYENIPHSYGIVSQDSSSLDFISESNLVLWTGSLDDFKIEANLKILAENIQWAYSGTLLSNNSNYKNLLDLDSYSSTELENKILPIVTWQLWLKINELDTGWRAVDPNCSIPDITIWTQRWAWCNSTLWWLEYNAGPCYNYQWADVAGSSCYGSTSRELSYNITYGTDNIWWKLYPWYNNNHSDTENIDNNNDWIVSEAEDNEVCWIWYHIPTEGEWEVLETTLNWWVNCRNNTNWRLCDGLWWKDNMTKNPENNLVQALKIPFSGSKNVGALDFTNRGRNALLWLSKSNSSNVYGRYLSWYSTLVFRGSWNPALSYSVRCIKD